MTVSQMVEILRRRHNAEGDSNWADAEIYQLISNRSNEAISVIGLIQATATATSVAGTQAYAFPTGCESIEQVEYKNQRLKRIGLRDWDMYRTSSTTQPSGTPTMFTVWANEVVLIPIPSASSDTIRYRYWKSQDMITTASGTIDIPSVLHSHLIPGVLADMYAKDLNVQFAQMNEQKWNQVSIPAFRTYAANNKSSGQFEPTGDSDTVRSTSEGIV